MPRGPRISFEQAFYHIFNRGVAKQPIFLDDYDYQHFLRKLENIKTIKGYDYEIYTYVLMPNHFHLLIQTKKTPISKIMSSLSTSYSIYFNLKYQRVGPLFQNRFRSKLCERDTYFLGASRYIHLNPIEAGLVNDLKDYPWSSYQELFGDSKFKILTSDVVRLIGEKTEQKDAYLRFLLDGKSILHNLAKKYTFQREVSGKPLFNSLSQKKYLRRRGKNSD